MKKKKINNVIYATFGTRGKVQRRLQQAQRPELQFIWIIFPITAAILVITAYFLNG
jgi:UPF0716 family protein affecting phage T7 exclusion